MAASKVLSGCLLGLTVGTCLATGNLSLAAGRGLASASFSSSSAGQSTAQPSTPPSSGLQSSQAGDAATTEKESSSHRSVHHIQVPEEDAQPAELTEAEAAIEKKNYPAAETLLHKLVEREPASYVAWFDLGFVENALGNVDESIAAYRKSVAAKPDVFESNLNLGLQLAKTGQSDAETFLRAATHLKPTSDVIEGQYRAWLALAQTMEQSRPEEALAGFRKAAALQPNKEEPHLSAGRLLERRNKFGEAEAEYGQALTIDPHSSDAVIGLANIYMRAGRLPEAEDSLRKLLAGHGNSAAIHIQLGRVLAAEGKKDAAVSELETGVKLAPGDEDAQRDFASVCASAGKNDLAEASYRTLLAAHPDDAELHRRLGEALLAQKKFTEAQAQFAAAVKLKPDLGEGYGGLAFAAGENKNYELVIRALQARAKLLPENAVTYFMRASAYDHLRDFKNAAANYRLFLNAAHGKYPDQEWQAKHRLIAIEPKK